jgi:hypothetical protein
MVATHNVTGANLVRTKYDGYVLAAGGIVGGTACYNAVTVPSGVSSNLYNTALIKARLKMKRSDINLGQAFAEADMTARLLGDTAIRLAQAYRALRKGRWKEAMRRLGVTPSRKPNGSNSVKQWLELQYGWKPLLSDIYGATEALTRRPQDHWLVTGKGSAKEKLEQTALYNNSPTVLSHAQKVELKGMQGCFVRIDAAPANELLQSFTSLGLTNPLLIAWELVPFSFVVDWGFKVGDYLSSLDAMLGYDGAHTYVSVSKLVRAEITATSLSKTVVRSLDTYVFTGEYTGRKSTVLLERSCPTSVPFPQWPSFRDPRSLTHMANGLALLAQVFGGKRG